jgi:hypothetical protein
MLLPASGEQIRKLGERLASGNPISPDDDHLLEELVACHLRALELARPRLNGLPAAASTGPLHITARAKTTGTIIEKLRREHRMSLARMGDLAGFRIVGAISFADQDRLGAMIAECFPADPRAPKLINRRATPSHGYRAYGEPPVPPEGVSQEQAAIIVDAMMDISEEWSDADEQITNLQATTDIEAFTEGTWTRLRQRLQSYGVDL